MQVKISESDAILRYPKLVSKICHKIGEPTGIPTGIKWKIDWFMEIAETCSVPTSINLYGCKNRRTWRISIDVQKDGIPKELLKTYGYAGNTVFQKNLLDMLQTNQEWLERAILAIEKRMGMPWEGIHGMYGWYTEEYATMHDYASRILCAGHVWSKPIGTVLRGNDLIVAKFHISKFLDQLESIALQSPTVK